MVKPDTEREKELIEAFEIVLSYVRRVYGVEYDRPIGFIVRRLLACVEEESIGTEANRFPGQKNIEVPLRQCGLCKRIITGTEHPWWDEIGELHIICERCSKKLKENFGRNVMVDKAMFE